MNDDGTERERLSAAAVHLSWFVAPLITPIAGWLAGRWIGSATLRAHAAAAANAHATPVVLALSYATVSWLAQAVEALPDAREGGTALLGMLVVTSYALPVLLVAVGVGRSVGAVRAAVAARHGRLRHYAFSIPLLPTSRRGAGIRPHR